HLYGRKVYLTLNTLIKEKEFGELYEYLVPFYEAGLDGVIVQDMGVFAYVRQYFPLLPLHVSTQMTVTGVHAARMLKEEGARRIVPARELSLGEIRKIKQKTGLEIETFVHGAMCYCYSGQCLFSSMLGGRSGNRGKCAQPCRLPYEICMDHKALRNDTQYPMSLKDLCTIQHVPELIRAGIDSFKIEGRMKKPEYAAGVTSVYRKVIDAYYENGCKPGNSAVNAEDMHILRSLYIRSEVQDGYYFRHNGGEMITRSAPGYNGSDEEILQQIRSRYLLHEPKLPLRMYARFYEGQPAVLTVCSGDVWTDVSGDVVTRALKRPVSRENIMDGLSAVGETNFRLEELTADVQEGIFYPLKAIKDLRRQALEQLNRLIEVKNCPGLGKRKRSRPAGEDIVEPAERAAFAKESVSAKEAGYRVLFTKKEQFLAFLETGMHAARIYLDADMCAEPDEWKRLLENAGKEHGHTEVFLVLPHVIRDRDEAFLEGIFSVLPAADGCMVRNMEGYAWLREKGYTGSVCGDAGVYVWNRETVRFWKNRLSGLCIPYELSAGEQKDLSGGLGHAFREQVVYGYLPMMVTANCMAKTGGACPGKGEFALRDRYKKEFPVYINCRHCYNVIYNSVPLSLHEKVAVRAGRVTSHVGETAFRLDFTIEKPEEVKQTLRFFERLANGEKAQLPPYAPYTTGHEKKGAD
ncbi:MAG: U32 family peptidase, partial [Lachnospiraceae bacterium]|nr:U32 family peptidase [Lachnospiraceae bacterium]